MTKDELKNIYFSFYDQLLPEHAEKAKSNYDNSGGGALEPENHEEAVNMGFIWSRSPQGEDYWDAISNQLEAKTYPLQLAPQKITVEVKEFTAPELTERPATDEDYEKLEDVVKGIKATDYIREAPATEPNFGTKDTNPKDSLGIKKVPLSGMPAPVLLECGLVKLHGDLKYGRYNWREAGVRASVYYDASMRHMMAWYEGEDLDTDSGIHHIAHAITGLMVLRDSMIQGNWKDDRPKPTKAGWVAQMNEIAKNMIEKHENDR